eukprot:15483518-Alexandrium_andersonii.AAC.1
MVVFRRAHAETAAFLVSRLSGHGQTWLCRQVGFASQRASAPELGPGCATAQRFAGRGADAGRSSVGPPGSRWCY